MKNLIFLLFKNVANALSGKGLGKIPGIFLIYEFIYKTVKPKGVVLIDAQGNKMYVDCRGRDMGVCSLLITGYYEKYVTEIFKQLIKPGMVVIDIGANIGYFTLIAAKLVGREGKVYAFEPEPNNFRLLVKNIKINGYSNIVPIQKALYNKSGKRKLFTNKVNLRDPSFSEDNVLEKEGFVEVETITLGGFFGNVANDNKVDLIKMDVQGAEGLIIEGARKILRNNNLKIIMEFWPYGLKNIGTDPLKVLHKLQNYGFEIKLIDEKSRYLKDIEIMKIIDICENAKDGKGAVNLLLENQETLKN